MTASTSSTSAVRPQHVHMSPEVIELDSDSDDDVVCTGQFRKVKVTRPTRVPPTKQKEVFDLTSDGDEELSAPPAPTRASHQPVSSTSSVRRNHESSLGRALEKGKRIVAAHNVAGPSSRSSGVPAAPPNDAPQTRAMSELIEISDDEEEDFPALDVNYHPHWSTRPSRGKSSVVRDLNEELAQSTRELVASMPAAQRRKGKAAMTSIYPGHYRELVQLTSDVHLSKAAMSWSKIASLRSSANAEVLRRRKSAIIPHLSLGVSGTKARLIKTREIVRPHLCPGSINSIVQSGPVTVIASCVHDGDAEDDERNMPYNNEGTLKVLYSDKDIVLHEHEKPRASHHAAQGFPTKAYTVNDVQFDPADSTRFASCGRDKKVIIWNCDDPEKPVRHRARYTDAIPEGLQYKPSGSVFAVWTDSGTCLVHKGDGSPATYTAGDSGHAVQSIAWGRGSFVNNLYATSGADNAYAGCHKSFDVGSGSKKGESFGSSAAGECLDVDATGTWLAHATCGEHNVFKLAIYDLKKLTRPIKDITLPPFVLPPDSESKPRIQQVLFAPDSRLLAVARSDNVTHIYDARFLGRSILYELPHGSANEATKEDGQYGINKVEWLEDGGHGLNLVSCGADGCVRLWDVKHAYDDYSDTVVAESTSYGGWFSLGDMYKGEKPLIMGDGSGNVIIRDRTDTLH